MPVDRRTLLGALALAPLGRTLAQTPAWPGLAFEDGRFVQGGWARGRLAPGAVPALAGTALPCAADGRFLIAFDRDAPASLLLTVTAPGAAAVSRPLAIALREWRIEQVDAPFHPPALPDAEFLAIRARERAAIDAARARETGAQGWRQAFAWPAHGRISGHFGAQRVYRGTPGTYHGGTDIAGAEGAPIAAPADGVVVLAAAEPFTLEGRLLMVDHGMGLSSAFLHCSAHEVRQGDAVRQGEPIARIGMTGRATGPHLHWGLRWRDARLDPELFVSA